MKTECQQCCKKLNNMSVCFICSYECTFCEACTILTKYSCPNCQGVLVKRPFREKNPVEAGISQILRKLGIRRP
ncbi:MAG: DUF1272 domain-containing protein [Pseudobdellovibrionaceae bacterium]